MSAVNFILSLARKILARESKGITTIPNQMAVEQKAGEIAATLQSAGLPLNRADEFIKSEQDLTRILNMIESTPPVMKEVPSGIRSTKSAKVFDMEGKEIKNPKNIMGGKEVKETEAQIKTRLDKGNKEGIARIKARQKMLDDAIDNVSPSLSGDTRTDAVLVAEDLAERMGLVYDDLPIREQTKFYDQAYQGLSKMRFEARQTPKGAPPKITSKKDADSQESSYDDGPADFDPDADNETFATGGRAGFKLGSIDKARRAFLKTVGAAGAGITALKTGLLSLGKEAAPIVDKAVETVTEAPSYFFDLVAKIKLFGKQRTTPSYKERVNEFTYTGKNGDQYELIEDLDTGEIMIQKDKMGVGVSDDKSFDVINDRTEMRYKKPKPDEGDPNPSEEYEEYKVEFDQDGTAADASQIDEISKKEIIEEVTEDAPSIKKAGGGIARMLGE